MMNGRLDGHIVQGHVDQTATCVAVDDAEGSWYFTFKYKFDKEMAKRGVKCIVERFVIFSRRCFSYCFFS
jgi:riboflavin synthase alpha subunit